MRELVARMYNVRVAALTAGAFTIQLFLFDGERCGPWEPPACTPHIRGGVGGANGPLTANEL